MSNYLNFSRKTFEEELNEICSMNELKWRDLTEQALESGQYIKERLYEVTTKHDSVRILIYSSLDVRSDGNRNCGADAVRINLWMKCKWGKGFKKFKRHYRTKNLFKNLLSTIEEVNEWVQMDDNVKRWAYGIKKGNEQVS